MPGGAGPNNGDVYLRHLENALMPLRCVFCGERTVPPERSICAACDADLARTESPVLTSSPPLERIVTPLAYEFPIDAAIKAYKFRRRLYYAAAFVEIACAACRHVPGDVDAVLPVPLHWRRQWWRGFNQAREIGRPVAGFLDVPLIDAVARRRATPSQSGLTSRERARNLRAAFVVRGRLPYRHVLIVDDVITTGTTVDELAGAVHDAGVGKVSALAIAHA